MPSTSEQNRKSFFIEQGTAEYKHASVQNTNKAPLKENSDTSETIEQLMKANIEQTTYPINV